MTLAGFLGWEERQPLRYEFDGVGPVAMTGGTYGHSTIQGNLAAPDLPESVLIGFGICSSSGSSSRPGDCSGQICARSSPISSASRVELARSRNITINRRREGRW